MTSFITIPRLIALFIAFVPAITAYVFWKTDYRTSRTMSDVPVPQLFRRHKPFPKVEVASQKKKLSFPRMSTYVCENRGNEDEWRETTANVYRFSKTKMSDKIWDLSSCFVLDADKLMDKQAEI